MITQYTDFHESFDFRNDGHIEWLLFDMESVIATLETDCEWLDGLEYDCSLELLKKDVVGIYSDGYQLREYCVHFFKDESEAVDQLEVDLNDIMPIKEFKQLSLDAAYQFYFRLMNVLEMEYCLEEEGDDGEYEYCEIGNDFDLLIETELNVEKASYMAILKSELDRCYFNILIADKNYKAIKEFQSRKNAANKTNKKWLEARKIVERFALSRWEGGQSIRILEMVDLVLEDLYELKTSENPLGSDVPSKMTIRKWISCVAPRDARKPGRPSKK